MWSVRCLASPECTVLYDFKSRPVMSENLHQAKQRSFKRKRLLLHRPRLARAFFGQLLATLKQQQVQHSLTFGRISLTPDFHTITRRTLPIFRKKLRR